MLEHALCRRCGTEMRIRTVEPMDHMTRVLFECQGDGCGHSWCLELPRRRRGQQQAAA